MPETLTKEQLDLVAQVVAEVIDKRDKKDP